MKVQFISDIHLEFYKYPQQSADWFVQQLLSYAPAYEEDEKLILVLAGDICSCISQDLLFDFLEKICDCYYHVIYIYGNHEYYVEPDPIGILRREYELSRFLYKILTFRANLHVLNNDHIVIDGNVIAGTTLWFDVAHPDSATNQWRLNDFRCIPGRFDWLLNESTKCYDWICSLPEEFPRIDLLITHHGVSSKVHDKWKGKISNIFYYRDITDVIARLNVGHIIFGHQHSNHSYTLPCLNSKGEVLVQSNCMGYPGDRDEDFNWGAYIEL